MRHELADAPHAERLGPLAAQRQRVGVLEAERRRDAHAVLALERSRHVGEQLRARRRRAAAPENRGPERPRVVHVDVDLAGAQRIEQDRRAEPVERLRGLPRLALEEGREQLRQHVLLGEGLGADANRPRCGRRLPLHGRERGDHERDEQRQPDAASACGCARARRARAGRWSGRGRARAARRRRSPTTTERLVARLQPAEDQVAEARRTHRRRERRGADRPHRGRAHARHDHRQGQRQLDAPQLLAPASCRRRAPPRAAPDPPPRCPSACCAGSAARA